jgi:hypothetical protein
MFDSQEIVALVLACAALEGAHAAVVRANLLPMLLGDNDQARLVETYLREQGIHTLMQITPYLFLGADRPTPTEIEQCAKALEMRNGIIHAKRTKRGYKLRDYARGEISDAYSAVIRMYSIYDLVVPANET